jgi:hypothetical protein
MRRKTYHFKAAVSDGKHHDGECEGIVEASNETSARRAIADQVVQDGRKNKRHWTATHIELN